MEPPWSRLEASQKHLNIWCLKSSEGRFETFLALGLKPLPERLKSMARELFFGLDRIFVFLDSPEGCFGAFLDDGQKPLPERFKSMAREPF